MVVVPVRAAVGRNARDDLAAGPSVKTTTVHGEESIVRSRDGEVARGERTRSVGPPYGGGPDIRGRRRGGRLRGARKAARLRADRAWRIARAVLERHEVERASRHCDVWVRYGGRRRRLHERKQIPAIVAYVLVDLVRRHLGPEEQAHLSTELDSAESLDRARGAHKGGRETGRGARRPGCPGVVGVGRAELRRTCPDGHGVDADEAPAWEVH